MLSRHQTTNSPVYRPDFLPSPRGRGAGGEGAFWLANLALFLTITIFFASTSTADTSSQISRFVDASRKAALAATTYDPSYARIAAVNGDLPPSRGVCSDVVIRGLRAVGIDLQDLVHQDMLNRPGKYKSLQRSGSAPDRNIDHRRVTNLMVYFHGDTTRFATINPPDSDWQPGDVVCWNLAEDKLYPSHSKRFVPHIGVVSDRKNSSGQYLVIHHLPEQGKEDDMLHRWTIIAHFRPQLDN